MRCAFNRKTSYVAIVVVSLLATAVTLSHRFEAHGLPEYERYVHTFIEPAGNWTYMEKPMFPVVLNESQIAIGENWSIVCPLLANHSYHAYCYGKWVNTNSTPKTDYDIYVYNPVGELEGYHTEAAGLPEHLGTTVNEPYFTPRDSANHTFVIVNDARESKGTEQATFMILEAAECNVWNDRYVEGKDGNDSPVLETSWAYTFASESQHVEVYVDVPSTLDMYEVRLYLMSDNRTSLNGVPLAWEPGLYGERNDTLGGYNLESKEYRGAAYASCEQYGQDMFLNWTAPRMGKNLYHLVFIGEAGNGTVNFLVKTQFGDAALISQALPVRVYPQNETTITCVSNRTDLVNATFSYSADGWANTTCVGMQITDKRICNVTIPAQAAGTIVLFKVQAEDTLRNQLAINGSYAVKHYSTIDLAAAKEAVTVGENITVNAVLAPEAEGLRVNVVFTTVNSTKEVSAITDASGTLTASFQTENVGVWQVTASFEGDDTFYSSSSQRVTIRVEEPTFLAKYGIYIGGATAGIGAACGVVVVKKRRS